MSTSLNYHVKRDTYRCCDDAELAAISIAMKAVFNNTANNKGSITLTGDAGIVDYSLFWHLAYLSLGDCTLAQQALCRIGPCTAV